MMLRLMADDPAVVELTGAAVSASNEHRVKPTLQIICQKCGSVLAKVGDTECGPLFTSVWTIASPLFFVEYVRGRKLSRKQALANMERHLVSRSGQAMDASRHNCVVALLALPANVAPDYPDLLVRCAKHGDAILDRLETLQWLRESAQKPQRRRVTVSRPFAEYTVPAVPPWAGAPAKINSETYRLAGDVMNVEDFRRRLAERRRIADTPGSES